MSKPLLHHRPPARTALRTRAGVRAWNAAWLAWLLLALVLVPTLGRVHQALHSTVHLTTQLPLQVGGVAPAVGTAPPAHAHTSAQGLPAPVASKALAALVPTHASGADCLLLDQLALADVLLAPALGVPASHGIHAAPVGWTQHAFALHRALFQARAPPAALRA
ncbi:hypothetical protein [Acidovorax sp. 1608163]|uniref:hypothetical protein n=1 Tax=Acidovorax sp. 1608163 TaxID=2478662 RepID=UPI001F09A09A|nr:hypothetical protein [Acidovorax sp. 1608163]